MERRAPYQDLIRVAKSSDADIDLIELGCRLAFKQGATTDDAMKRVAAARWRLAKSFRIDGERALKAEPPMNRVAVNRFYYCMYHSMRAVMYLAYGGDHYQDHAKLATKEPAGFIAAIPWQNALKSARLERNMCDYDPYPASDQLFAAAARSMHSEARAIHRAARDFLHSKGAL